MMPKKAESKNQSEASEGGVEAVDRAMQILAAFTRHDGALSLHELSARTGFYKSTLLRLLVSLERARMIQRRPDKMFVLGPEVMRLSASYQENFSLAFIIRPVLRHIVDVTGESSSFYVLQGERQMMCLVRENSPRSVRDHAVEGDAIPLKSGASASVLTDFRDLRADNIPAELLRALPYYRQGDIDPDIAALSAPVFSFDQTLVGALSVSGPRQRLTAPAAGKYKNLILSSARNLSAVLGMEESIPRRRAA